MKISDGTVRLQLISAEKIITWKNAKQIINLWTNQNSIV